MGYEAENYHVIIAGTLIASCLKESDALVIAETFAGRLDSTAYVILSIQPRVFQTWQLLAQGLTNSEIAKAMTIKPRSVENNINTLYQILEVRSGVSGRVKVARLFAEGGAGTVGFRTVKPTDAVRGWPLK